MGELQLEIVTPEKVMVRETVEIVVAPGTLGEFGILKGHVPFLSGIVPGEIRYTANGQRKYLAVTNGFAEVFDDKVSVLVDAAEKAEEIDLERARQAMERAKERLAKGRGAEDVDFLRADLALRRAIARVKVSEKAK